MKRCGNFICISLIAALAACSSSDKNYNTQPSPSESTLVGQWEFNEEILFTCALPKQRIYQAVYRMDISGSDSDLLFTTVKDATATLTHESDVIEREFPVWPFYFDEEQSAWTGILEYIGQGSLEGNILLWSYSASGLYPDEESNSLVTWTVDTEYDAVKIGDEIHGSTSFELPNGCTGTVQLVAVRL